MIRDDDFDNDWGTLWEALAAHTSVSAADLVIDTGTSAPWIRNALRRLERIGLAARAGNEDSPEWSPVLEMDALTYARAVETGIPLDVLERTASVAVREQKKAARLARDGVVDAMEADERHERMERRRILLRGKAASRAAATDLAHVIADAQKAWGGDLLNPLHPGKPSQEGESGKAHKENDDRKDSDSGRPSSVSSAINEVVREAFRSEAVHALNALVDAMERP